MICKLDAELFESPQSHAASSIGIKWSLPMMKYSEKWKESRKMFQHEFGSENAKKYRVIEIEESQKLLVRLLKKPEDFANHIR